MRPQRVRSVEKAVARDAETISKLEKSAPATLVVDDTLPCAMDTADTVPLEPLATGTGVTTSVAKLLQREEEQVKAGVEAASSTKTPDGQQKGKNVDEVRDGAGKTHAHVPIYIHMQVHGLFACLPSIPCSIGRDTKLCLETMTALYIEKV